MRNLGQEAQQEEEGAREEEQDLDRFWSGKIDFGTTNNAATSAWYAEPETN